jgi:hypothetical protein
MRRHVALRSVGDRLATCNATVPLIDVLIACPLRGKYNPLKTGPFIQPQHTPLEIVATPCQSSCTMVGVRRSNGCQNCRKGKVKVSLHLHPTPTV